MPGMVDTHLHAPQYAFCGTRVGIPLLEWLNEYTFPIEAKYKDTQFAEEIYSKVVVSDQPCCQLFPMISLLEPNKIIRPANLN